MREHTHLEESSGTPGRRHGTEILIFTYSLSITTSWTLIGRLTLDVEYGGGGRCSSAVGHRTCVTSCILRTHFLYLQKVQTRALVHVDPPTRLKLRLPLIESQTDEPFSSWTDVTTKRPSLRCQLSYSHLVPCDPGLWASGCFGGELSGLSQFSKHSARFSDELWWALAPDTGPVLSRGTPGIMGNGVL